MTVFSLELLNLCFNFCSVSVPLSPPASSLRKNYESPTTPSPATSPLNDTPSPIRKAVPKVDSHLVGYPAGNPAGQPAKSLPVLKIALPKAKNIPKAAPFVKNLPPEPPPQTRTLGIIEYFGFAFIKTRISMERSRCSGFHKNN